MLAFLGCFARCEYALKRGGFAKGSANSVEANWDLFAQSVDKRFTVIKESAFREAVTFLLAEPPRKQVLRAGSLQWKEAPPNPKHCQAQQVLLMVRRVRNNLFHGAKVWSPEYGSRDRDVRLLKAGIVVLRHCMRLNEGVHGAYEVGTF